MSLKGQLKRQLTGFVQRIQQSEELRLHANRQAHDYDVIRRKGLYHASPYSVSSADNHPSRSTNPIFISGRFRSGSTLLWNLFRSLPGHVAYYEPFNERRWFDPAQRGGHTDSTHRGVSDYWSEYQGLEELADLYDEDWIRYRLYMSETSFDYRMKQFIDTLVAGTRGRAVLQFNRMDFRLPWLRANYPDSPIVHVYRNPRDQWCSTLRSPANYPSSASAGSGFRDHFYLEVWFRDLVRHFPFLADYEYKHRYYLFYFIWRLSYCFGVHYSDVSLAMEHLTQSPARAMVDIFMGTGIEVSLTKELDLSFVEKADSRWQSYASASWFANVEQECDAVVRDFLQGVAN